MIRPPVPVLSEFKGLSRALRLPDARITAERSSPYGLMQVFASPALRYAPGLSLTWQEKIPEGKAVFNNGDWFGAVVPRQGGAVLDHTTGALPYALEGRRSVLILDAGTCSLVSQALDRGAERITAVEPHPVILSLLGGELARETGDLLRHPAVSVRNLSSRTFLARDTVAVRSDPPPHGGRLRRHLRPACRPRGLSPDPGGLPADLAEADPRAGR